MPARRSPGIGLREFHVLFETACKHRACRDAKPDSAFVLRKTEQMARSRKATHRIAAPCGHGDMWRDKQDDIRHGIRLLKH